MLKQIKISPNTSIEQIESLWCVEKNREVEFHLTLDSSFQLLTEGFAVAKLRDMQVAKVKIIVVLTISKSLNDFLLEKIDSLIHPISSIFGLQLIYVSAHVFLNNERNIDIRHKLATLLWRPLVKNNNQFNFGQKIQFVSNHTIPVPAAFGGQRAPKKYANYQKFKSAITRNVNEMWSDNDALTGGDEDGMTSIAFHAAENSFDHAREENGKEVRGYWGLTLQKIIFSGKEEIEKRNDIPNMLKNYFLENFDMINSGAGSNLRAQVISIDDIGPGIHETLKKQSNESWASTDIVNESFKDFQTCKVAENSNENPGFGLGDLVFSARSLRAFLFLQSGPHVFYYDFSDDPEKMTNEQKRKIELIHLNDHKKHCGVNISVVWISQFDKKNLNLF